MYNFLIKLVSYSKLGHLLNLILAIELTHGWGQDVQELFEFVQIGAFHARYGKNRAYLGLIKVLRGQNHIVVTVDSNWYFTFSI